MVKIGVIGHTGRLGKPLMELLKNHPHAEVVYTGSRREGFNGNLDEVELVFLTLPKDASKDYIDGLRGKRLIDLSVDNRANPEWVYGIPEINRSRIRDAERVANPGCYATSIVLGLLPVKGLISKVNISATSGISGAGKAVETIENSEIYKEGIQHDHLSEIRAALGYNEIISGKMIFVPEVIRTVDRGIVSKIFAEKSGVEPVRDLYTKFYANNPFVSIVDKVQTADVNGTNNCNIKVMQFDDRLIVLSAIDNMIRGGSGQAVQNFNIMYGFNETLSLPSKK